MIKPIPRNVRRASSFKVLRRRIAYIEDSKHPDHASVVVHRATNYNCDSQKPEDFENGCLRADKAYREERSKKRHGKSSKRIFEELVYSTPRASHVNDLERKTIETTLVNTFARHSPCRLAWHENERSGRSDLHILVAAKTDGWPPSMTLSSEFGGGKKSILSTINRVSNAIIKTLNKTRDGKNKLKSAQQVHKDKVKKILGKKSVDLASELADLNFAPGEVRSAIESLGYEITRENEASISVLFPGAKRANRFNKDQLNIAVAEAEREKDEPPPPPLETKKVKPKTEKKDEPPI